MIWELVFQVNKRKERKMIVYEELNKGSVFHTMFNSFYNLNQVLVTGQYAGFQESIIAFCNTFNTYYAKDLANELNKEVKRCYDLQMIVNQEYLQAMFQRFWQINKGFLNGDSNQCRSDEYWEILMGHAETFYKEFKNPYACRLMSSFLDEVERRDHYERDCLGMVGFVPRNVMTG